MDFKCVGICVSLCWQLLVTKLGFGCCDIELVKFKFGEAQP